MFFPPEAALAAELLRRGARSVYTCYPTDAISLANEALLKGVSLEPARGRLVERYFGIEVLAGRGGEESDSKLGGLDIAPEDLERYSRDAPGIAIDTSLSRELIPKELAKLRLQIDLVKGLVRRLRRINKFVVAPEPLELGRVVLLDPSAEEELVRIEPRTRYVLGGIVDKGNRLPGITARLADKRNAERRRITLFGRLEGVTNTLVGIARILIYMMRGVPKDLAVILSAPRRVLKRLDDPCARRLLRIRKNLPYYAERPMEELSRVLGRICRLPEPRERPRRPWPLRPWARSASR